LSVTEPHHEPSYYEIALTNRQVVVAFVILLACLLAAFFSGVWIGRGGIEPRGDQMVRATPPAQAAPEGHTLEELKFFADRPNKKNKPEEKPDRSDRSEKSAETVAAPAPVPTAEDAQESRPKAANSTLQQDLEPSSQGSRGSGSRSSKASPNSVVRSTPPTPVRPEPAEETARPEPVQSRPAERPSEKTSGAEGSVVIQVFASADQAEAGRVRDRLKKGGQAAFLSPLTVDGRTMYRVRIGPFTSRPKAQTVAEKVRKNFKLDTWLTQ
jgi:cell division septation protein DedD